MKRDSSIEMARILGCLIVIGVHTCLAPLVNEQYDMSRVFISSLMADGVAVFWIITGCFYFHSISYKKTLCKTLKSIGVPMFIFSLFSFYFSSWIFNDVSLIQSIYHSKEEYVNVFKTLLTWNNPVPCGGHLWYLYTNILLALVFPVLKSFVNYLEESPKKRIRYFVAISFCFLIINDITSNQLAQFSLSSMGALFPASVQVIYGFIIYKNRDIFCKKRYIFIAPSIFLIVNMVRSILQIKRYYVEPTNNSILFWFSSLGVLCAMCIIVFCISLNNYISNESVKKVICHIASYTFYIYLIHTYVIALLGKSGFTDRLSIFISKYAQNAIYDFLYTFIMVIIEFFISLIFAGIIKILIRCFNKIGRRRNQLM